MRAIPFAPRSDCTTRMMIMGLSGSLGTQRDTAVRCNKCMVRWWRKYFHRHRRWQLSNSDEYKIHLETELFNTLSRIRWQGFEMVNMPEFAVEKARLEPPKKTLCLHTPTRRYAVLRSDCQVRNSCLVAPRHTINAPTRRTARRSQR